jgi:hypothetical protein
MGGFFSIIHKRSNMKKIGALFLLAALLADQNVYAQFKQSGASEQGVMSSMIRPPSASDWFGFFNPDNLFMRQSYSMSYTAFGSQGLALGRYTNSMLYRISNTLDAQVDISLQHSPYSTLSRNLQNSFTGIFVDRAQINYRPAQNVLFQISYRQLPWSSYYGYSPLSTTATGLEFDEVK